jgi:DNA-binding MarR family transcriptional regulator
MAAAKLPTPSTPAGRLREATLHHVLGYQLAQASIVTHALYSKHTGRVFDLRPAEYTLLTLVVENPGGSMARLAKALAVSAPNITAWVVRLEARELVIREKSESDKRTQMLRATAKGVKLANQATAKILEMEKQSLHGLSALEQYTLLELLHKVGSLRASI